MRGCLCLLACLLLGAAEGGGVIGESGRGPSPLVYAPELLVSKKRWMTDGYKNNDGVQLRRICIPGTHNSATHGIQGVPENLAQCQELSLYEQLARGHRYLDLRVKKDGSDFWIHHGDVLSVKVKEAFDDIDKFAEENPKEILIVHIQNVGDMSEDEHKDLTDDHVVPTFGAYMAPRSYGVGATFKKFWDNSKSLILIWGGANYASLSANYWHQGSTMNSHWSNTNSGGTVISDQLAEAQLNRNGRFLVTQFIITPQVGDIIFPPYWGSIEDMTDDKLDHLTFTYELDRVSIASGQRANIVMVDFGEYNDQYGVEACVDVNGISDHFSQLQVVNSGRCMDVSSSGTADGTKVILWTCNGGSNQQWRYDHASGLVHSKLNESQCLSSQGSTDLHTLLVIWTCTEHATAFDFHTNSLRLRSDATLAVDAASTEDGARIYLYTSHGGDNQRWMRKF
ncbi:Endo-1 [Diplonema papillatum]|nr:Endo-1 [Diplonema papillatum]